MKHFFAALALGLLTATAAPAQQPASDPQNTVYLETKDGRVTIRLRPDLAPKHVEQIKTLTKRGFYDGVVFHRVIDGFMAQTGDPTGTGTGKSDLPNLPAEFTPDALQARHRRHGALAEPEFRQFAVLHLLRGLRLRSPASTRSFGEVVSGMDVVDKIKKGDRTPTAGAEPGQDREDAARRGRPVSLDALNRAHWPRPSERGRGRGPRPGLRAGRRRGADRGRRGSPSSRRPPCRRASSAPCGPVAGAAAGRGSTVSATCSRRSGACWQPPRGSGFSGQEMTIRLSFKRSGEVLGQPADHLLPARRRDGRPRGVRRAVRERLRALHAAAVHARFGAAVAGPAFHLPLHRQPAALNRGRSRSFRSQTANIGDPMADPENTLVLETTKGRVVIELRPDLAPGHVERIKTLARQGFYDGVAFHRVIEGFMAQTGCPKGTGTGGSDLPDLQGRVQRRAACARHRLDGAHQRPALGELAVLHLLRRRPLPRQAVHGLGQGHRGDGERRQDQARRARARSRPHRIHEADGGRGLSGGE